MVQTAEMASIGLPASACQAGKGQHVQEVS